MRYNPDLHHRRSIRLKGYDYSSDASYFVTILAHKRQELFGQIGAVRVGAGTGALREAPLQGIPDVSLLMQLSPEGCIIDAVISELHTRFHAAYIDKYVIMPNHIHMIVTVRATHEAPLHGSSSPSKGKRSLLSKVIGYMKMNVSKRIRAQNPELLEMWHRDYYESIIRNVNSYRKVCHYIDNNPQRWAEDRFYGNKPT